MPTNHAEGDSVIISATVTHFNGLMQLTPYFITRLNQGNTRKTPVVVTAMNESTESDFIELQNVSIPTPAQWIGSSTNTNAFNVNIVVNSKTYVMRIEPETELATKTYAQSIR